MNRQNNQPVKGDNNKVSNTNTGFSWKSFGIGAGTTLGILVLGHFGKKLFRKNKNKNQEQPAAPAAKTAPEPEPAK